MGIPKVIIMKGGRKQRHIRGCVIADKKHPPFVARARKRGSGWHFSWRVGRGDKRPRQSSERPAEGETANECQECGREGAEHFCELDKRWLCDDCFREHLEHEPTVGIFRCTDCYSSILCQ